MTVDIANREGLADYDVMWPWHHGDLRPGLSAVLRVRDEAHNLPWVLPPILRAVDAVVLVDNQSSDGTTDVAIQIADKVGLSDRMTVTRYPFDLSRCGPEHLATSPDSVHSLTHFCNWAFAHVRTTYSMKWDGDMVLTEEGVAILSDLAWRLQGGEATLVAPIFHPLNLESDRVAYLDLGSRHREPWVYPMGPRFTFLKAFEWEVRNNPPGLPVLRLPEGLCFELKWLDRDEFSHWTDRAAFQTPRTARKQREWEVFTACKEGRWYDVDQLVRLEAPDGMHVVDYVTGSWLGAVPRPLPV